MQARDHLNTCVQIGDNIENRQVGWRLHLLGSGQEPMADACECEDGSSGLLKGREFIDQWCSYYEDAAAWSRLFADQKLSFRLSESTKLNCSSDHFDFTYLYHCESYQLFQ